MSQTILITGGTGFVGSHLVQELLEQGETKIHVTTQGNGQTFVHSLLPASQIHQINLTDHQQVHQLFLQLKPTHIYHLASIAVAGKSFEQAHQTFVNNISLQLHVLDAYRQVVPKARLLLVGSAMEYDFHTILPGEKINESVSLGPVSPYAVSKTAQDLLGLSYFYSYQLDIVRVRPFNHIGERQTTDFAVPSFAEQIIKVERGLLDSIQVGNLSAVRDFTDVKDVVKAYRLLMEKGKSGEVYNVGSGIGHTMRAILEELCQLSHTSIKIVEDSTRLRPLDVPEVIADTTKIAQLGWAPTIPITATLQRIIEYWRQTL